MLLDIATSIPVIVSVFIGHSVLFSIIFIVMYFSMSAKQTIILSRVKTVKEKNQKE